MADVTKQRLGKAGVHGANIRIDFDGTGKEEGNLHPNSSQNGLEHNL